jgi:hypothetical protein
LVHDLSQAPDLSPSGPHESPTEPALTGTREHAVNELKSVIINLGTTTGLQAEAIGS